MEGGFLLKNELVVGKIHKACLLPYLQPLAVEASVEGTIFVTQAQTFFRITESGGVLVSVAHGMLERLRKVSGKEKTGQGYVVDMVCKDLRTLRFALPGKLQYKQLVSVLEALAYELEISQLFAMKWNATEYPAWRFDAAAEYERCGLHSGDHRLTSINKNYSMCDSYPQLLAVPAMAKDEVLTAVAEFRSRGRLPVATYLFQPTGAALYRCSQPLVGLKNTRCSDDEILLSMMAALPARSNNVRLHIMDARPKVAAVGNKFLGAGMEHVGPGTRYDQCLLEYMNIGNIHTMRGALQKLVEALEQPDARKQEKSIDQSDWKEHIGRILTGAVRISDVLVKEGHPVLVHCLALDMEILTSEGYLSLGQLLPRWDGNSFSGGLLMGTVSGATHALEWQACDRLIVNEGRGDGVLIEFFDAAVNVSVRVTPEHAVYVKRNGVWLKMTAKHVCECLLAGESFGMLMMMASSRLTTIQVGIANVRLSANTEATWCLTVANGLIVTRRGGDGCNNASSPMVVGNCTDGWDRTAQLTCLTQLMLDPYYRTIEGFAILVEKEWLSFGHKFAQRHGHGTFSPKFKDTQRAPIFLQFVDCCWQLSQQFPTSFEWNERMLIMVVDACYSCLFGTFLCNTDQERRVLYRVTEGTVSLWSYLLQSRKLYSNPLFDTSSVMRLHPKLGPAHMQIWRSLYCRFQWSSVNELMGIPFATPDLSVLTFNCTKVERTQTELARAAATAAAAAAAAPPPPASPNKPPRPLLPLSRVTDGERRVGGTRVSRSGSVTMDEIEGARRRRLSLEMDDNESLSMGGVADDDEEEDDEEQSSSELAESAGRRSVTVMDSMAEPSEPTSAVVLDDLDWTLNGQAPLPTTPSGSLSPRNRQDASKRRGVKLDANEILKMAPPSGEEK